jgi:mannose-6-phosphate isomerase-like protein (cupin superfamily)
MAEVGPLRRRMIEDITIRNLSPATQQSYLYAVAKFSRHCGGRSPNRLGLENVRASRLYLIAQQRSWIATLSPAADSIRRTFGPNWQPACLRRMPDVRMQDLLAKGLAWKASRRQRAGSSTIRECVMKVVTLKNIPEVPAPGAAEPTDGYAGPVHRTRQTIIEPGESANFNCSIVNFSQGCNTGWHVHDCDQILIVTSGSGWVATDSVWSFSLLTLISTGRGNGRFTGSAAE